ncbi:PepSY domain-containing protein [Oceanobacillus bengalensis]|uniref:PepSY domain-containing protein n=1 Tax=Oceanobacillus bengalensis TaxID=1435466 RepID=A0A494YSE4_9BACI|nr:PepSY domain-containing protein [Oceanobacillus bengalensis]RKQ12834.1 hypothetical protein D8M05_17805 [Oceanobacillus bengalensis]
MMKKKVLAIVGAMSTVVIMGLAFSQSGVVNAGPNLTVENIKEKVGNQYPGEITELKLDNRSSNPVYEVELKMDGKKYELALDGNTGEILRINEKSAIQKLLDIEDKKNNQEKVDLVMKEKENTNVEDMQHEEKTEKTTENSDDKDDKMANSKPKEKAVIGESKAKEIALGQFPGYVEEIELDHDDGTLVYEIKIENNNGDAEIELDAYTGEVIVVDIDMDDD